MKEIANLLKSKLFGLYLKLDVIRGYCKEYFALDDRKKKMIMSDELSHQRKEIL